MLRKAAIVSTTSGTAVERAKLTLALSSQPLKLSKVTPIAALGEPDKPFSPCRVALIRNDRCSSKELIRAAGTYTGVRAQTCPCSKLSLDQCRPCQFQHKLGSQPKSVQWALAVNKGSVPLDTEFHGWWNSLLEGIRTPSDAMKVTGASQNKALEQWALHLCIRGAHHMFFSCTISF